MVNEHSDGERGYCMMIFYDDEKPNQKPNEQTEKVKKKKRDRQWTTSSDFLLIMTIALSLTV